MKKKSRFSRWIFNGLVSQSFEFFILIIFCLPRLRTECELRDKLGRHTSRAKRLLARRQRYKRSMYSHWIPKREFFIVSTTRKSQFHKSNHVYIYFIFILQYWFSSSSLECCCVCCHRKSCESVIITILLSVYGGAWGSALLLVCFLWNYFRHSFMSIESKFVVESNGMAAWNLEEALFDSLYYIKMEIQFSKFLAWISSVISDIMFCLASSLWATSY